MCTKEGDKKHVDATFQSNAFTKENDYRRDPDTDGKITLI
jgi:hypothetical protein